MKENGIKYTNILHNERRLLGISLIEYCICDAVYHLQNANGEACKKSREWMANEFGIGIRTTKEIVDRMVNAGLLYKTTDGHLKYSKRWAEIYTMAATEIQAIEAVLSRRERLAGARAARKIVGGGIVAAYMPNGEIVRFPHHTDTVRFPHSGSAETAPDTVRKPHYNTTIYNNTQQCLNKGTQFSQQMADKKTELPLPAAEPKKSKKRVLKEYTVEQVAGRLKPEEQAFYSQILNSGLWARWIEYKKTKWAFTYANEITHAAGVSELFGFCGGNEDIAAQIVNRTISKQWKGLWALQQNGNNASNNNNNTKSIGFTGDTGSEFFGGFKG